MSEFDNLVKIVGRWNVTVCLEYIGDVSIAASSESSIRPFMLPDGSIDQLALSDYEEFVVNLLGVFERTDFEVIEDRQSPYSHSYYFDLVKKDQLNKKDFKYILFIRVSDHALSGIRVKQQKEWFDAHAQELKQPKHRSKQRWILKYLTVNKDTYFSYDEALDDLEDRLESMR